MAYSSAITICGGQDIYMTSNNWVSFIPILLSAVVFSMIVLNRKGVRTWIAAVMAVLSTLLILLSHQLMVPASFYTIGGVGLLLAIWVNGNLFSFVNQLINKIRSGRFDDNKAQITYPINQK